MASHSSSSLELIFPYEGEAWPLVAKRAREATGDVLLILAGRELELVQQPDVRKEFLAECKKIHQRLRIAAKHPTIVAEARAAGLRVFDRTKQLKAFLSSHPRADEALRAFSPHLWRQQLKSQLQRMGLLSMPKLRIFSLAGLSVLLFFIVVFRLLPSADIYINPRQEAVSQTMNIFLVQSGATADISDRVRHMPLVPITVHFRKSTTFDHISKEFIGTSSRMQLTVVNASAEEYSLRKGTRFTNQAGMVFTILDQAIVAAGEEITVRAQAQDLDLYGQIIGERGNVPAGLRWDIPGLAPEERQLVYGENRQPAAGGTTAYRTVLKQADLELAQKRLEQELLAAAKQMAEEERSMMNEKDASSFYSLLNYAELTKTTYNDFVMPTQFIDQVVTSVPIEGGITYTAFVYDARAILDLLKDELQAHVQQGRTLIDGHLTYQDLVAHVIDYSDDLSWIKLTVDLTATEEYILDPLSPVGALFAKKVRELVTGVSREEAIRIVRNMPEVESVEISQWPPWNTTLPGIASHISVIAR